MIIGVTGFRRSGKDSTTKVLQRLYGFKQYAFADALREIAAAINPVMSLEGAPEDIREVFAYDYARYRHILDTIGYDRGKDIPDVRHFLQKLGTEGIRNVFGPNAWVDALHRRLQQEAPSRVCISDVRFLNEAEWVKAQGGILWRVVRPGVGGDDPHPSEKDIPNLPADREIVARSLDVLERAVINAFELDSKRVSSLLPSSQVPSNADHASSPKQQKGCECHGTCPCTSTPPGSDATRAGTGPAGGASA